MYNNWQTGGNKHTRPWVSFLINLQVHKCKGLPKLPQGCGHLTERIENEVLKDEAHAPVCSMMTGMDGQLQWVLRE